MLDVSHQMFGEAVCASLLKKLSLQDFLPALTRGHLF